ncbi:MAG: CBS domain-containing protein [Chloroflexota bacterium]|nr:CBS domain-containing protein [Chloroflexota bacterium]MDE2683998.1 CBS domain-containing protein [Chloroflexota bacterium]
MSTHNGDKWLVQAAQRMKDELDNGNVPTPERLTVRDLVGKYGFQRRSSWVTTHIQNLLDELELRAVPDIASGWIDATISIELDSAVSGVSSDSQRPDPIRRIDSLDAAHNNPVCVKSDAKLNVATTLMLLHDYSQLPVMDNLHGMVKGVISWQSIGARFALGSECDYVRQCMEPAERIPNVEISKNAPLMEAIGIIAKQGYVLVRDRESQNVISGIVTATDLSNRFAELAEPFLLMEQIEKHLRNLIHREFTLAVLQESSGDPNIAGSADMTLGGYQRLLERPAHWEELSIAARIDHKEFVKHLCCVRKIRNSIMHFNTDGLSEKETEILRSFAGFFDYLVRMSAM